jgi:hypothetical protein
MQVEKLQIVPVRDAFRHEAHNFTHWLEQNIDALSERLGIHLTVIEREKAVGSFSLDLFCEDGNGYPVIIENQLEKTDHDHLGKLLTYLVNLDAKAAVWVATEVRQEHLKVINWLNEYAGNGIGFYFVKVEAIRIGNSPFAPLFTVLARPDVQAREVGEEKKEFAERHTLRLLFWEQLLAKSKTVTKLGSNRSPSKDHWLTIASGRSGIGYNYLIQKEWAGLDVYIDVGDPIRNKQIFDQLFAQKDDIEAEFGDTLDWRRMEDKRASRIVKQYINHGNLIEQERWDELQELMINAMIRFERAFSRRIHLLP